MSMEELDTKPNFPDKDISDGTYEFTVSLVTKKEIKGKKGYEWVLEYDGKDAAILMWPNQMGPLLRILKVQESAPNKFMFDPVLVEGMKFKATAYKDKKGYQQLKDYAAIDEIPF